jgi:hypothetical protein
MPGTERGRRSRVVITEAGFAGFHAAREPASFGVIGHA